MPEYKADASVIASIDITANFITEPFSDLAEAPLNNYNVINFEIWPIKMISLKHVAMKRCTTSFHSPV